MKVLVTLNSLELGGTQLNAVDFARQARTSGVDSVLVGYSWTKPDSGPSLIEVAEAAEVPLLVIDEADRLLTAGRDLDAIATQHDVDLVHAYGGWDVRPSFWGPHRFGRLPLVMTVYEMAVPDRVYRHPDLIIGTKYLEEEQTDARPGAVHLISPPVNLANDRPDVDGAPFLAEHGVDPAALRIVIVSRVSKDMKAVAIEQAMQAVRELDRPDAVLMVVGSGSEEARLRQVADEINTELGRRAVVFTGAVSNPALAYASADVAIGMGGSAARSLAFGKPLIVSGEHGWYRTFDEETKAALYRDSFWSDKQIDNPIELLVDQLRDMIDDPDRRARLGTLGRQFAEANFGLEQMTERMVSVYEHALATQRRRSWFADLAVEARPLVEGVRRRLSRRD